MTLDKERLRVLAEAATGWSNCDKVWPHAEYDEISVLGAICEEGVQYPVAEIDADTYGDDGDSLKLAQFYAGANPAAVLALLAENAALAAEVERLRTNAARYEWLRGQFWHKSNLFVVQGDKSNVMLGTRCPSKSSLDAAIDAAMADKGAPT